MSEDTRQTLAIAFAIVAGVAIVVGAPTYCTIREDLLVADMVAHGADPIKASCAVHGVGESAKSLLCAGVKAQ